MNQKSGFKAPLGLLLIGISTVLVLTLVISIILNATKMKSIEQALVLAYNKNYGTEEGNVDVILDKTDGQIHVFQKKEVVKKVEDVT